MTSERVTTYPKPQKSQKNCESGKSTKKKEHEQGATILSRKLLVSMLFTVSNSNYTLTVP